MKVPSSTPRQVFVSYSLRDRDSPIVEQVLKALSEEFEVLTVEEMPPGAEVPQMIANLIKKSKSVVAILPEEGGHWVYYELALATSLAKATYLIVEEHRELSPLLDFGNMRIVRYRRDRVKSINEQLKRLLRKSAHRKQKSLPRRRPERFEVLVARVFEAAGYRVTRHAQGLRPHTDILASFEPPGLRSEVTVAIECKFRSKPVGIRTVREVAAKLEGEPFIPVIVTNSSFTEPARRRANEVGLLTMDGKELERVAKGSGVGPETITWIEAELEFLCTGKYDE